MNYSDRMSCKSAPESGAEFGEDDESRWGEIRERIIELTSELLPIQNKLEMSIN